ncbi:FliH/SctL family protein [Paenibacillus sp. GCM10023252]|uniref:FliH/SctL family protein n=1 Tax=Paenibacillus sp. GCM10023252 TaxID=3252649 RepID=UPI00360612B4
MSNLIKSAHVVPLEELKQLQSITHHSLDSNNLEQQIIENIEPVPDEETISLRDQILADAKQFAEEQVRAASEQSEQQLKQAEEDISAWWEERRSQDEFVIVTAQQDGYSQGYADGQAAAEADLKAQWEHRLAEASGILQTSYQMREQIIQESEPFLVELSIAIAEKVIGEQLTVSPSIAIDLIRKSLSRRREQGVIALCVAPSQLAFVQAAREELNLAIDSQAELQILPDSTVKDSGCVIRSAYGSIDSRIDTQLAEIKRELMSLALDQSSERGQSHAID